jgi:DHA1 family solute carrier family 18 vesicular amine transporter 1/2
VRRLLVLVGSVVLVDLTLYAALTPLLPEYSEEFGLSKTGSGLLFAVYAIGVLAGAFPAGLAAARLGAKPATLTGLLVVGAASLGFGFAGDEWTLGAARLVQGLGSAFAWAGGLSWLVAATPRERRGEVLGTALGAAVFGVLLGPVVGGIASLVGARLTFTVLGLAAAAVAFLGLRVPGVPPETPSLRALIRAVRHRRFLAGFWLMLLPALLFGVVFVLAPLDLDRAGWSGLGLGALFFSAAAIESVVNPFIGRLIDRRGSRGSVRTALAASVALLALLAFAQDEILIAGLVLLGAIAFSSLFTPGLSLLSTGAEEAGLPQGLAFGVMNAGWATGATLGPAAAGALGETVGDPLAYALAALACATTLTALAMAPRPGTLPA